MNALRLLAFAAALLALTGMSRKPRLTVRAHLEANGAEGAPFSLPVKFANPPRDGFMDTVPAFSERNITGMYPTPAGDGTWGCAFTLDTEGRIALETLSREHRGSALVVFVATKKGTHQVVDMVIDRPVSDGIFYIPRGLTAIEIEMLRKQFKLFGPAAEAEKAAKAQAKGRRRSN